MVSDSSNNLASNPNELLQSLLTKTSTQSRELSWDDMGRALLREQDAILANTMVFVKVSFILWQALLCVESTSWLCIMSNDENAFLISHISLSYQSFVAICSRDTAKYTGG